jgi:hypothetical protein
MAGRFEYGSTIATPAGLLSYPKVFKPEESPMNPGKPKFSCAILVPKQGADITTIVNECRKVAAALFGDKFSGKLAQFGDKQPIKDGDLRENGDPANGHWILSANATPRRKPWILDRNNKPLDDEDEIYGGAIGLLWVQPVAYDMDGIKGVKLSLEGVQKIADGEPFVKRWNPLESCTTLPQVPAYLQSKVVAQRPSFGPRRESEVIPPHEQALRTVMSSATGQPFNGDIEGDDSTPF